MQTMTRDWMYNADRCSKQFIDGVHYFLRVADENKWMDSYVAYVPCVRI